MKERLADRALLCAVLILLASASSGQARDLPTQQSGASSTLQELIDLQKAFVTAQERGDAEYVRNALDDDFTLIETNGSTTDKLDFVRDIHPPDRPGPPPILYDIKVLQLDESCAVVTYRAVFPGNQLEKYQFLSDIWVKQGSRWKLKFQQSTLNLWSAHDLD